MNTTSANRVELPLEVTLRARRDGGAKLLVPYITAGHSDNWVETLHAVAEAGADAIELGIPFSDPIMDGPVIQEASQRALERGVTPVSVVGDLKGSDPGVPTLVMTYCNLVFHAGFERFAGWLGDAGISGTILPDLPLEEAREWSEVATANLISNVLLVAPTTSKERAELIARESSGFVYGIGLMGVTGVRDKLASSAQKVATMLKSVTDKPVLVGVGVSSPAQAREVAQFCDGVIVGSALVKILNQGGGPQEAFDFISSIRKALDAS